MCRYFNLLEESPFWDFLFGVPSQFAGLPTRASFVRLIVRGCEPPLLKPNETETKPNNLDPQRTPCFCLCTNLFWGQRQNKELNRSFGGPGKRQAKRNHPKPTTSHLLWFRLPTRPQPLGPKLPPTGWLLGSGIQLQNFTCLFVFSLVFIPFCCVCFFPSGLYPGFFLRVQVSAVFFLPSPLALSRAEASSLATQRTN